MYKYLGDAVTDIEFSESEEARLSASFKERSGVPYKILSTKYADISKPEFWAQCMHMLAITGFRPNKAKEIVLRRVIDGTFQRGTKAHQALWRLYRTCVGLYMNTELVNLNKLLERERIVGEKAHIASEVFREIAKKAALYDVTDEQIREFYELWGFERFEGLNQIIGERPLDLETVKHLIKAQIQAFSEKISSDQNPAFEQLYNKLEALEQKLEKTSIDLAEFRTNLDSVVDEKITNSAASIKSELPGFAYGFLKTKLDELRAELDKTNTVPNREKPSTTSGTNNAALVEFQERFASMAKRLKTIELTVEKLKDGKGESGPQGVLLLTQTRSQGQEVVSWHSILEKWAQTLRTNGSTHVTPTSLAALLCSLRASSVLILDRPELVTSLFHQLCGDNSIIQIAAAPFWMRGDEWKMQLPRADEGRPKVLVINDFDVALQEAYLVPPLREWATSKSGILNKVILVPSKPFLADVSPRVLEMATVFDASTSLLKEVERQWEPKLDLAKLIAFLGPSRESGLFTKSTTNPNQEEDLRKLAGNSSITLPNGLLNLFSRLYYQIKHFAEHEVAFKLALQLSVLPWIRLKYGENHRRIFEERTNDILGSTE